MSRYPQTNAPEQVGQNREGQVVLGQGAPIYSKRSYRVRRLKADAYDSVTPESMHLAGSVLADRTVILYQDVESGILVSDVRKFEAWIEKEKST